MPYRLFLFGPTGHIVRAEILDAASDEAAIPLALSHVHAGAAELWSGARRLASFEPGELGGVRGAVLA